jgi:hypothetical protein
LPPDENNPLEKNDESREMKINNNNDKNRIENIPEYNMKYRNENTVDNKTIDNTDNNITPAKR